MLGVILVASGAVGGWWFLTHRSPGETALSATVQQASTPPSARAEDLTAPEGDRAVVRTGGETQTKPTTKEAGSTPNAGRAPDRAAIARPAEVVEEPPAPLVLPEGGSLEKPSTLEPILAGGSAISSHYAASTYKDRSERLRTLEAALDLGEPSDPYQQESYGALKSELVWLREHLGNPEGTPKK